MPTPGVDASPPGEGGPAAPSEDGGGDFDGALKAALAEGGEELPAADDAETTDVEQAAPDGAEKPAGDEAEAPEAQAKEQQPAAPKKEVAKSGDDTPERKAMRDELKAELRGEFTALARDRQKLRDREAAAEQKVQAAQVFQQKAQACDSLVHRLRTDPVGLVHEAGGDELVSKVLDDIVAREKSPAEREVDRMRAELRQRDEASKVEAQKRQIADWQAGVRREVEAAGERFDLVNALGQHDAVIETIEQYYVAHAGAVLPTDVAAQAVEDLLAKGLARSKKFGARAPDTNAQPSKGTPAPPARKGGARTLSSVPSSELPSGEVDDLPLDDTHGDRFKRALALAEAGR
jgi:hypothetical protein